MVIEALKAARDFIENDRQALAESLTVNGEIVFEDDTDRRAMAEYVNVLVVIDEALRVAVRPVAEKFSAVQPARVPLNIEKIKELQIQAGYKNAPAFDLFNFLNGIRYGEAAHGISPPKAQPAVQEPIYQMQMMDGKWIDQAKQSYEYNKAHGHTVRIVYTTPPAQPAVPLTDEQVGRTDREIVDQTEELAGLLMRAFHRRKKADPLSTFRGTQDIRAQHCWQTACQIQEMLTDTDPMNAVAEVDDEAAHGITKGQP
jgi:hypothetical protein